LLRHSRSMVAWIEVVGCVGVIAAAANYAGAEYRKLRATRRCNEALRRTLCTAFGN
jgi:dihydrodipicolinate synthase/N-acetylneuraminate lyase